MSKPHGHIDACIIVSFYHYCSNQGEGINTEQLCYAVWTLDLRHMRYIISVFIISSLLWVITMMKHQHIHCVYKHMDEGKNIPHVLSAAFKVSERELGTQSTHTQVLLLPTVGCWG